MSRNYIFFLLIWFCCSVIYSNTSSAQEVYPCDHRYGAIASWSQCTDVLVPDSRYKGELYGFKYNLALTVFDSPFSVSTRTDKYQCAQTGRMNWGVYFQTDRWAKPDDYAYPSGYRYYDTSSYPLIPDYYLTEWTEVGKHYYPKVVVGEKKDFRYPNHGQQLYDISDGKYGYDYVSGKEGEVDILSGIVNLHREWVKNIAGHYPSCVSYRQGELGAKYGMKKWFLAGRNSNFGIKGRSITAYGYSVLSQKYLGYPDNYNMTHNTTICQASSTRWWDSWNDRIGTPPYASRAEVTSYARTIIQNTIDNGGWYNDFTHWHYTTEDDLGVFFKSQRETIESQNVYSGSYGEIMQHYFLRSSVKRIDTSWIGSACTIEVTPNDSLDELPLFAFSIPLSVQVDLSGTSLSGKDISSPESPGIRKLGYDLYAVDIPFDQISGFQAVTLELTEQPQYFDLTRPKIKRISSKDKVMVVQTDKPTRLALFWCEANAPEYTAQILYRSNTLDVEHSIDFSNQSVLTYGGPRTWNDIEQGDIYVGAITKTKQSVLSRAYSFGSVLAVDDNTIPSGLVIAQNFPNPFNASTTITFEISEAQHSLLVIYGVNGQKITTLVDSFLMSGTHQVNWEGTDNHGIPVSSGLYFCTLKSGGSKLVRKLMLMK